MNSGSSIIFYVLHDELVSFSLPLRLHSCSIQTIYVHFQLSIADYDVIMSQKKFLNIDLCTTCRALSDETTLQKKCPKFFMGFFDFPYFWAVFGALSTSVIKIYPYETAVSAILAEGWSTRVNRGAVLIHQERYKHLRCLFFEK